MGIEKVRPTHWLRDNRAAVPSLLALVAVAVFWFVGAIEGIGYLAGATSPMAMVAGLYVGLAVVALSVIIVILALTDLTRRYARPRTRR